MSDNGIKGLCQSCAKSVRCETWAEWRCLINKKSMYDYKTMTECPSYKKRPKDFKERDCQCEDCLKDEWAEDEESEE